MNYCYKFLFIIFLVYIFYGTIASILGLIGVTSKCNYDSVANIISCKPGKNFGELITNISYIDYLGNIHNSEITFKNSYTCVPGQLVELCYPQNDPSNIIIGDHTIFKNPKVPIILLATGLPAIILAITIIVFSINFKIYNYDRIT